jgi:hypothetical protein
LEEKNSGSGVETKNAAVRISRADYATLLYPQKLVLTSLASGGRSIGIVRSRSKATELLLLSLSLLLLLLLLLCTCMHVERNNEKFMARQVERGIKIWNSRG